MNTVPIVKEFIIPFLMKYLKDSAGYLEQLQKQYGDQCSKKLKGINHYFLFHPSHAEHVLSTNQDNYRKYPLFVANFEPFLGTDNLISSNNIPQWRNDRELCKTAFEAELFFQQYTNKVTQNCKLAMDDWQLRFVSRGLPCPIGSELDKMALRNINESIFHNLDVDVEIIARHIPQIFNLIAKKATSITQLPWIFPSQRKRSYDREVKYLQEVKNKALLTRLRQRKDYDDLLGTLLSGYKVKDADNPYFGMVANHMMTFNVVGYSTTTSALRWIVTTLSRNPEMENRIASEVLSVCNGREPVYEDFDKLVYTRAFVMEVLRINPPLAFILRELISDDTINNYRLSAGGCIVLSVHRVHRHPDYWANPEAFDPERFISKPYGQDYQYAYIPFGGGRRSCIGRNFALLELTLMTAMMVQRFQFILPEGFTLRRTYVASVFVRPNLESVIIREK